MHLLWLNTRRALGYPGAPCCVALICSPSSRPRSRSHGSRGRPRPRPDTARPRRPARRSTRTPACTALRPPSSCAVPSVQITCPNQSSDGACAPPRCVVLRRHPWRRTCLIDGWQTDRLRPRCGCLVRETKRWGMPGSCAVRTRSGPWRKTRGVTGSPQCRELGCRTDVTRPACGVVLQTGSLWDEASGRCRLCRGHEAAIRTQGAFQPCYEEAERWCACLVRSTLRALDLTLTPRQQHSLLGGPVGPSRRTGIAPQVSLVLKHWKAEQQIQYPVQLCGRQRFSGRSRPKCS